MAAEWVYSIWMIDRRCPRCGGNLATNGKTVWCCGVTDTPRCEYGQSPELVRYEAEAATQRTAEQGTRAAFHFAEESHRDKDRP